MSGKTLTLPIVVAALLTALPAKAETFKSADFLKWAPGSQRSYFATSVTMASAIVRVNSTQQSTCINTWYGRNREKVEQRFIAVMRQYPDYHPQSVILAVIEKQCGSVKYRGP